MTAIEWWAHETAIEVLQRSVELAVAPCPMMGCTRGQLPASNMHGSTLTGEVTRRRWRELCCRLTRCRGCKCEQSTTTLAAMMAHPSVLTRLADAEVWLRKALDLGWKNYICNFIADAQIHLACLVCFKGDEDEAVELLTKRMEGFMQMGPRMCAGCMQLRGDDAPMLTCKRCRVARFV